MNCRSAARYGGLVLAAVISTQWVKINISPSAPRGVYRLTAVPQALTRGTLVVLSVPEAVQAWHSPWLPMLKPVAAVGGDTVCVWDDGLWIGMQHYGPAYQEARGMSLPRLRGCLLIGEGEVFLASAAPRSLDGRYMGVTPVTALTAQAHPVFTWR